MNTKRAAEALQSDVRIVADFVSPCGHCGIPCLGTFRLWYVDGGKRATFEVDRPTFSELLEAVVKTAIDGATYESLPAFIRDWNEATGWAGQGLDEAVLVDTADILSAVEMLRAQHAAAADARITSMTAFLDDFVRRCSHEGRELWAGET